MNKQLFTEIGNTPGIDGEDLAQVNRAVNHSLLTGMPVGQAFDSHDEIREVVAEKKTFYSDFF